MTAFTPSRRHPRRTRRLVQTGAVAGLIAATVTTLTAALARVAGAGLEVQGEAIPLPAFTMWTVVGALFGVALALILRQRRRFLVVTLVGTALSLLPPVALPGDGATTSVLVIAHLVAAAIIVPPLARHLSDGDPPPQHPAGRMNGQRVRERRDRVSRTPSCFAGPATWACAIRTRMVPTPHRLATTKVPGT